VPGCPDGRLSESIRAWKGSTAQASPEGRNEPHNKPVKIRQINDFISHLPFASRQQFNDKFITAYHITTKVPYPAGLKIEASYL
jgi:hypothetical protein